MQRVLNREVASDLITKGWTDKVGKKAGVAVATMRGIWTMKGKRYSQEQNIYALKQVEAGAEIVAVCRQLGVSVATFCEWKRALGNLGVSELNELCDLHNELRRLKQLVAYLTLDSHILQEVIKKNSLKPVRRRDDHAPCVQADVFGPIGFYYRSRRRDYTAWRRWLRELAGARIRYSYRQLTVLLRREGWPNNANVINRLYREENLGVTRRKWRKRAADIRVMPAQAGSEPDVPNRRGLFGTSCRGASAA